MPSLQIISPTSHRSLSLSCRSCYAFRMNGLKIKFNLPPHNGCEKIWSLSSTFPMEQVVNKQLLTGSQLFSAVKLYMWSIGGSCLSFSSFLLCCHIGHFGNEVRITFIYLVNMNKFMFVAHLKRKEVRFSALVNLQLPI
jgi:hypothetical protein